MKKMNELYNVNECVDGCDSVELFFIDNPKFEYVKNATEFKFEAKMNYTVKLR